MSIPVQVVRVNHLPPGRSIVGQIRRRLPEKIEIDQEGRFSELLCKYKEGLIEMKAEQTEATVRSELDGQALLGDLRRFVEGAELSIPRIAELMGVYGATLSMWIAGTAKPRRTKLLEIESFLASHSPEYLDSCSKSRRRAHDQD